MLPSENCPPSDRSSPPSSDEGGFAQTPNPRSEPALSNGQRTTAGSHYPLLATRYSLLISYFRSGWAFLIPYLAVYLLYAWLKWPVNPASGGEGIVKGVSEGAGSLNSQLSTLGSQRFSVPPLLYVYWFLHGLHLILGCLALRAWWRKPTLSTLNSQLSTAASSSLRDRLWPLIPWLCLALLFWIPGIYLEWPSDPWEHLRRINEWHILDQITAHSSWKKSSYFLPYSLTSFTAGLVQLSWLNVYYTAVCLLLSWQSYRLARAIGLGERVSFIFVLLNALTFGNNIFSFYRYYGLSSSIIAQIGAIALTRVALEVFGGSGAGLPGYSQIGTRDSLRRSVGAGLALLPLIAFNHIQGLGIAGLGILAGFVWRLIEWRRSMIIWLATAAGLASIAMILWFPRHPALDEIYRPQGWLAVWYGFNFFSATSPAFERSLHILGTLGGTNILFGLWLIARRNDVAGWLTLTPLIMLALPCFALPFASMLASEKSVENIVTFHRLLFAVPLPLAVVVFGARIGKSSKQTLQSTETPHSPGSAPTWTRHVATPMIPVCLLGLVTLSPDSSSFNRFWHSIEITPKDLRLDTHVAISTPSPLPGGQAVSDTLLIDTPFGAEIRKSFLAGPDMNSFRRIQVPAHTEEIASRIELLTHALANPDLRSVKSTIDHKEVAPDVLARSASPSALREKLIIADPTSTNLPWVSLGGQPPNAHLEQGRLVLSNSPGTVSHVFNPSMIPVEQGKRYLLSTSIRQTSGEGSNYLAVAWYDRTGQLLVANEPAPKGAGGPLGWAATGTYDYYGLVNQTARAEWTRYSVSFGLGDPVKIPRNAAFLRAGVLLNENAAPNACAEFTDVVLWERPAYLQVRLTAPSFRHLFTPGSQAAWLSGHWPPQYLAAQQIGTEELRSLFLDGPRTPALVNSASD